MEEVELEEEKDVTQVDQMGAFKSEQVGNDAVVVLGETMHNTGKPLPPVYHPARPAATLTPDQSRSCP